MTLQHGTRRARPRNKHNMVHDEIVARINSGIYTGKLPGVNQLARELDVNPLTLTKVLNELENSGVIRKYERVGTFVNRKRRIGFLILNQEHTGSHYLPGNTIFDQIIKGITDALEPNHYTLQACVASPRNENFIHQLKREVDGLIVFRSGEFDDAFFSIFEDIPWILAMGEYNTTLRAGLITYNNDMIGRMAADHLLEQKCDRYIYYGHEKGNIFRCRWESFMARLLGDEATAEKVFVDPYDTPIELFFEDSLRQLEPLLTKPGKPGLFLPSDIVCHTLYQILYKCGRSPQDVAVIACDNNAHNLHGIFPCPPSIDIRMNDIGFKAAESLLNFIAGQAVDRCERVILMPELVFPDHNRSLAGWIVSPQN